MTVDHSQPQGGYHVILLSVTVTLHRPVAPVRLPTVGDSMTSSDVSHGPMSHSPCDDHYTTPAHHVHVSSPTHHVHMSSPTHSVSSSESSTSDSQCSTPTNSHTHLIQTDTEDDNRSSDSEQFDDITATEKPFNWENLSEAEDKDSVVPAMVEPEELQLSPQQFTALVSEVSNEPSPSLQEAFRRHKANFISNSQLQLSQVKEKSQQRMATSTNHLPHKTPTRHGTSKNANTPKASSSRIVQFSSPLITLQDTGVFTPPTIHRANSRCPFH